MPLNKDVNTLNNGILARVPGAVQSYLSADFFDMDESEDAEIYPPEFLHTLEPSGMTPHDLRLKEGVPIIIIRNLCRRTGLMNGTRAVVRRCLRHSLEVQLLTGTQEGTIQCIPRINQTISK